MGDLAEGPKRRGARSLALGGAFLALACGYRPAGGPGARLAEPARIEVRFFENQSNEVGFERMLAEALVEEFARRGEFSAVYDGSGVTELALRGRVEAVRVAPAAFSSVGLALENRVAVTLRVTLLRAGEKLWEHRGLEVEERFLSSSDAQVRATNREQALRRLTSELAGRIHDEISQSL
jgi:hypothetical protein